MGNPSPPGHRRTVTRNQISYQSQKMWANQLNKLFRYGLGIKLVKLLFDPLDVRDRKEEMEVYTKYKDAGIMSINEVRRAAQLGDPVEGGDRIFFNSAAVTFVDELDDASSAEMERLRGEVESLTDRVRMRDQRQLAQGMEGKGRNTKGEKGTPTPQAPTPGTKNKA